MFQALFVVSSGQFSSEAEFPNHAVFEINGACSNSEVSALIKNIFTRPLVANRVLLVLYHVCVTADICKGLKLLFEKEPPYITLLVVSPQRGAKPLHLILTAKFKHEFRCVFEEHTVSNRSPFLSLEHRQMLTLPVTSQNSSEWNPLFCDNDDDDAILVEEEEVQSSFYNIAGLNLTQSKPLSKFERYRTNDMDDVAWRLEMISATDTYRIKHQTPPTSFVVYKQTAAAKRNVTTVKNGCNFNALEIRDLLATSSWYPTLGQKFLTQLTKDASCSAYALHVDLYLTTSKEPSLQVHSETDPTLHRPAKRAFDAREPSNHVTSQPAKIPRLLRPHSHSTHTNKKEQNYTRQKSGPTAALQIQKTNVTGRGSKDGVQPGVYVNIPSEFRIVADKLHQLQDGSRFSTLRVVATTALQTTELLYSPLPLDHYVYKQCAYALTTPADKRLVAIVIITNPTQPPQLHLVVRKDEIEKSQVVVSFLKGFEGVDLRSGLFNVTKKKVHAGVYRAHSIPTKSVDIVDVLQQVSSKPGDWILIA